MCLLLVVPAGGMACFVGNTDTVTPASWYTTCADLVYVHIVTSWKVMLMLGHGLQALGTVYREDQVRVTHEGTGMVRTWPPFPIKSTIAQ